MVVAPSLITVAKYGFLSLVVTSAGLLIGNIVVVKHHTKPEFADSLVYNAPDSLVTENVRNVLGRNIDRCLTEPSKSFCLLADRKKLRALRSKESMENVPGPTYPDPPQNTLHPIHKELLELGQLLALLQIRPVLLEPSMLYCLLSPSNKLYLIKKGFNPFKFQGSGRVVTLGIFEEDAQVLDQEPALSTLSSAGYNISRSRQWLKAVTKPDIPGQYLTGHFFLAKGNLTIHAAVLFKRYKYLWIPGLAPDDHGPKDLLFARETTFENFTAESLDIESSPDLKISIPSTPVWFLYQVPASEVNHCASAEVTESTSLAHPWLTPLQLRNRAGVAIQELKNLFYPRFITFWLWTETLAGWNEDCNIYSRTYELNVAVSHREIWGTNLTRLLSENDYLKILLYTRLESRNVPKDVNMNIALDCYGLRVNIFVCFEEKHSVRSYFSTEQGVVYSVTRPKFQLCSTEIFEKRIHVPCDSTPQFKWEIIYQHANASSINN